jgi:CHAT domain-containing protein/tetratricopeptide (TPR) repeat protein
MSRKSWIHQSLITLRRRPIRRLALISAIGLLLFAGIRESGVPAGAQVGPARAQDQYRLAALRKFNEGEALRSEGTAESLRLAAQKYQEALPLWRAIGAKREEAKTLNNIGVVYDSLGEYQKALDFYKQALPLWRAVSARGGEANTLNNIGHVYYSLGEKQKALDFLNQALTLRRAADEPDEEAGILRNIASVYESMGEKQKAQDFYAQADEALSRGRRQQAPAQDQNSLAAQRKLDEAKALRTQGTKESLRLAAKKYEEALPLMRAIGADGAEAATLNNIGSAYYDLGEWRKALEFYDQALPLWRAIRDRDGETTTLRNIGSVYNSLGEWRKALDSYNQALPLWRRARDRTQEATTLADIGLIYCSQREWQKALECYNRALSLFSEARDSGGEALALANIGGLYLALGENQKALEFYNQALPLYRAVRNRGGEATTLTNIGVAYNSLGEYQKALDYYNQALPLIREVGNHIGEVNTLNNIGHAYYSLGEYQEAADFYAQEMVASHNTGRYEGREVTAFNNIGDIFNALGKKQIAIDLYASALRWSRAVGDSQGEAATLYNIARTKRALGHFNESLSHAESVLRIIESMRVKIDSKDLRATYFARVQDYYEFYIDLLMQMHNREPARGYMAAALEASERGRALSLIEGLTEARANIRRGADPKLIEQEDSLQQRLRARENQGGILEANGADAARLAAHRREIDTLTIELRQVQTQIRQSNPRYAALAQPQPLTLAEIQRQALDDDTLLLEYSLGDERSFLWAVTPATINSYELPKREEVEAAAKRVSELMSKPPDKRSQTAKPGNSSFNETGREYLTAAAGLSRTLLGPVAGKLGKKRLLIVADGMLHYVSFGALPDPNSLNASAGGWQPLVVEHEIVNLPSATTLAVLRRELAGRKPAARTVAVLADPVFSEDDERINSGARLAERQTNQPASNPVNEIISRKLVQIAGATPGAAPSKLRIKRLRYTRQEAERIMALAPAGSGLEALDFEASRATVTSGQLSQYRYVHFATHGLADSERPELSTIALSLYDEQGKPQDGFLRAHEVYNLDLPAELVTLSACETGLGRLTRGEGLVSMTRGFMYAGAARVVVSLWSVNDRATAELMEKCYRRILVGGERPAAALRAAQVEMWRDKGWEAPYYWAAFTLQGEWR